MQIFNITLQSVAALLAIGVLGFWIIKRHIIPDTILQFLGILAIDIALPCIVFANIITQFSPSSSVGWWQYPLWWLAFTVVVFVLSLVSTVVSARGTRREFVVSLFFQNGIFFPFIVINGIFGPQNPYTAVLFLFIALHPSLFFGTIHLFFRKRGAKDGHGAQGGPGRVGRLVNPVLIATLAAAVIKLSGLEARLPTFVLSAFQLLGGMSMPLLMLILGGSLYVDFQNRGPVYFGEVIKFVLIKNVVFPLCVILLLILVRPAYSVALVMFLQAAAPPITGVPIQTRVHGGNPSITNQYILGSFVFSIISIPLMFHLFTKYFPMP
jgi:malate permease and related proteins